MAHSAQSSTIASTSTTRTFSVKSDSHGKGAGVVTVGEKPVATGNGISASIRLAEPFLFLQGYDQSDSASRKATMLRGTLILNVTKNIKIKGVTLNFCGKARTEWPEGIPPRKFEYYEEEEIMHHTWPFFNAQFPTAESGYCADFYQLSDKGMAVSATDLSALGNGSWRSAVLSTKEQKRLSLQTNQSRNFGIEHLGSTIAQKGYRVFHPGEYYYNFELALDSHLPETISAELGSVKYELDVLVERAGAFRANLSGSKEVVLIRIPSESSLEQVEPIAISRNWEDQLHYDICISGKSFPIGAQIPIAFKLTPLAKVQLHKVRVFITENIEYYCNNKSVHRMEPARKLQLFEKKADSASSSCYPGSSMRILSGGGIPYDKRQAAAAGEEIVLEESDNLLGDLNSGDGVIGPTEIELSVQLPSCSTMKDKDKNQTIHFDTTYSNIVVHHWIKIVMRLSRLDLDDPNKRRHFEISIDSPFHILSCQATQANTALPAYSSPDPEVSICGTYECGCPGAQLRPSSAIPNVIQQVDRAPSRNENVPPLVSLARPQPAHVNGVQNYLQRPMHILRNPSFNPPAFDADSSPPPLVTPPPQYDSVEGNRGLADYFSRLAGEHDDENDGGEDDGSDEDGRRGRNGRVNIPLTPGGRVNRSMDEQRNWESVSS